MTNEEKDIDKVIELLKSSIRVKKVLESCLEEEKHKLDKIRAEIMELDYDDYDGYEGAHISPMVCRDLVLQIIDKYRGEQK